MNPEVFKVALWAILTMLAGLVAAVAWSKIIREGDKRRRGRNAEKMALHKAGRDADSIAERGQIGWR